jgi:DNA repair protein RecO (recombination protein O)
VPGTFKAEAVVLRSLRYGEADRILHVLTREHGRLGAIAKGVRRTRSRMGGRLEPGSHVELVLHEGRGELATVTGVDLIRSHQALALDHYRLRVAQIGLEAVLRLFHEHDPAPRAFEGLVRFLDLLDEREARAAEPALDPLALAFQLKLLWLAGYLPHLSGCAACGAGGPLVGFSASAGGAVCEGCSTSAMPLSPAAFRALSMLLERPLAEAGAAGAEGEAARQAVRVVHGVYEHHGGFRLRAASR